MVVYLYINYKALAMRYLLLFLKKGCFLVICD